MYLFDFKGYNSLSPITLANELYFSLEDDKTTKESKGKIMYKLYDEVGGTSASSKYLVVGVAKTFFVAVRALHGAFSVRAETLDGMSFQNSTLDKLLQLGFAEKANDQSAETQSSQS